MDDQGKPENMSREEYIAYLKSPHPMFEHPFQVYPYRDGEIRVYRNNEFEQPVYQAHYQAFSWKTLRFMTVLGFHPTPEAAIAAVTEAL